MRWKPNVTVAAVIEQDGRYLLVEEQDGDAVRFNQPAGHLEADESLLDAVQREVREETGRVFTPTHALGVYLWHSPEHDLTYLRCAFSGTCSEPMPGHTPEHGIIATHWLTRAEIAALGKRLRSPLVLRCIDDALQRPPLALDYFTRLLSA